jgi:hypothetical protein
MPVQQLLEEIAVANSGSALREVETDLALNADWREPQ